MMIWKSVSGDVSSSSIVPDRFSSEYVRIVTIGSTNSTTTLTFWSSGRISCSLTFIACGRRHAQHLHALRGRSNCEQRVEEIAEEQREEADDDVGDRRGEVAPSAPCGRSRGCYSWRSLLRPRRRRRRLRWSACRKISSRLMRIGRSSSRPQPRSTTARASSRRTSRPRLALDFVADAPSRACRRRPTRVTPARGAARAARRRPSRPPARTSSPSRAAAPSGCRACPRRRPGPC